MTKTLSLALTFAAVAAAGAQQPASTGPVPLDRIVAVVGDQPITRFDVQERILQKQQNGEIQKIPTDPAELKELERQTVNDMVDEQLLAMKAPELKVEVTDADLANTVDAQVKRIRSQFPTETEFRAELAKAGLGTPEEYRRYLMDQLRRVQLVQRTMQKLRDEGKLIPANVTDAEVQEAFEKYRSQLPPRPPSVTFRQVVINPKPSDAAKKAAYAKAESLLVELQHGADFEKIAKRESMEPGARETGGDLGWARRGKFVPEFDRWLFGAYSLSPGQLSPVVETPFGYHIIRVDRAQPGEVKARHILIRPAVDSGQIEKARLEADTVAQQLRAGVSFDSLAKKHHDYANKEETTFRDPFPRDSLPAAYKAAFQGVKPNDIVTFKIPGTGDAPKFVVAQLLTADQGGERTLAEMRGMVRDRLAEEGGVRRYLDSLRKQTYVSIRIDDEPVASKP